MTASAILEPMEETADINADLGVSQPKPRIPAAVHRIVLTGFMGSGKTTTGRLLAERLGWEFCDLDSEVERRDGRSVPQIFAEEGEAAFRHLESAALASLLGRKNLVLALGGGAPETLGNRLLLEQTPHTAVVYLEAPLAVLLDRCALGAAAGETARPLLGEAAARLARRHPHYLRLADHRITTTDLAPNAVSEAILSAIQEG
jgi:shikimate kinase